VGKFKLDSKEGSGKESPTREVNRAQRFPLQSLAVFVFFVLSNSAISNQYSSSGKFLGSFRYADFLFC